VRVKREIEIRREEKGGRGAINRIQMHDAHRQCTLPIIRRCAITERKEVFRGENIRHSEEIEITRRKTKRCALRICNPSKVARNAGR
jgi:hypothetical protein